MIAILAWAILDAPASEKIVKGVVTQGVWKVERYSNATFEGVARVEDGTHVQFTANRSLPVGGQIVFYQYRRPVSGLTTYKYAGL